MSDKLDAVDQVISEPGAAKVDVVSLPADEVIRLREIEKRHTGLEKDTAASFIERDLSSALDAFGDLVPGAANQLMKLWKDDFQARRVDGRWIVEAKNGGSVGEVIKARLADPSNFHFIKGNARPGAGGNGTRPTPSPNPGGQQYQTYGHALLAAAQAQGAGRPAFSSKYQQ